MQKVLCPGFQILCCLCSALLFTLQETYGSFDYTSLLYLSNYGTDFGGGRFVFIDNVTSHTVEPKLGGLPCYVLHRAHSSDVGLETRSRSRDRLETCFCRSRSRSRSRASKSRSRSRSRTSRSRVSAVNLPETSRDHG